MQFKLCTCTCGDVPPTDLALCWLESTQFSEGEWRVSRWWFQIFLIFTPKIGEDEPMLTIIFFKWIETTNQFWIKVYVSSHPQWKWSWIHLFWSNIRDVTRVFTPKGSWGREIPLFQGKAVWWNILVWPDVFDFFKGFVVKDLVKYSNPVDLYEIHSPKLP